MIWWLGGGQFGRDQTQGWINALARFPKLQLWLNRKHGNIRAAAHYVEFGGLYLVLYWLVDEIFGNGMLLFHWPQATALWVICAVAAWLDEMHQLRSGSRQFRRVDFLHSCCGITIAMAMIFFGELIRLNS
jgi:VanZ family protein